MESVFIIRRYNSAEHFLDALALHRAEWAAYPKDWIFRGQQDAEWDLIPSAFRESSAFYYGANEPYALALTHERQVANERFLVRAFAEEMSSQGIGFPGQDSIGKLNLLPLFRTLLNEPEPEDWPPDDLLPLLGLAQHYGLPTRLLDWTRRPYVAAYFAALDASRRIETSGQHDFFLAVWALTTWATSFFREAKEPYWKVIEPPRASNQNLHAQSGVFTQVVRPSVRASDPPIPPHLNALVEQTGASRAKGDSRNAKSLRELSPILVRLDLPATQAWKLLNLLDANQVSATYLFPGVAGAVKGVRERAYHGAVRFPANWSERKLAELEQARKNFAQNDHIDEDTERDGA